MASAQAFAHQAPTVGDEGMEPGEGRLEMALGSESLSAVYRYGVWRSGITGVASLERSWMGGWTTTGFGGAYRLFGGYPLRLILRGEMELGFGPSNGPSLGLRATPGVAVELGKPWRYSATLGASLSVARFVLPTPGWKYGPAFDLLISRPIGYAWRMGLGVEMRTEVVEAEVAAVSELTTSSSWVISSLNGVIGLSHTFYPTDWVDLYDKTRDRLGLKPREGKKGRAPARPK